MNLQTGSIILHVTPNSIPVLPKVVVKGVTYPLNFGENLRFDEIRVGFFSLHVEPIRVGNREYITKFTPSVVNVKPDTVTEVYVTFDTVVQPTDMDFDGIDNELEINGYVWNPVMFTFEAYDQDNPQHSGLTVYRTNPTMRSTSGDPYADSRKASLSDLSHVRPPYNHPWVGAYPIIKAKVLEYNVTPIAEITDSQGNSKSTEFSESFTTSDSQTHGSNFELSEELGWEDGGLKATTTITIGYSGEHSWGTESTRETSSGEEFSWETATTVNTAEAATVSFNIVYINEGSLYAANIIPTFNVLLGGKPIMTHQPNVSIASLGPGDTSAIFTIGDGITLSLDDLKAVQLGTPLSLEMIQVQTDISEYNDKTGSWEVIAQWPELLQSMEPKTIPFIYTTSNGTKTEYTVSARPTAGTGYDYLQQTLGDILNVVLGDKIKIVDNTIMINEIPLDNRWVLYVKEIDRLKQFLEQENPVITDLPVYADDIIELREPIASELPEVIFAEFTTDYKKVKTSVVPGIFGITKVEAEVKVNGTVQKFSLHQNPAGSQFYETDAFSASADTIFASRLFVTDGKPNADGTTGIVHTFNIMGTSAKDGYSYQSLSSPQIILDANPTSVTSVMTKNSLKNSGPVNIDLNKLGVKGKTYVFQIESHRWSSSDVAVTIGDQTVQLGCDDYRPKQTEFKFEFKDSRPAVFKTYEGSKANEFLNMPPDIPGDQIQKITQINSQGVQNNSSTMEIYEHPFYNHPNGDSHDWDQGYVEGNGNLIFTDTSAPIRDGVSSFRVAGAAEEITTASEPLKLKLTSRGDAHVKEYDATEHISIPDLKDWNDDTEYVELIGNKPLLLQLFLGRNFEQKYYSRYLILDPYYQRKYNLWDTRIETNGGAGGLSSFKCWPINADNLYLHRGATSSPIVSRTVMVTLPDNATTFPVSWSIGGSNNADYARVKYEYNETDKVWRTVQTDAHIKVKLIGAFTKNESQGKNYTDVGKQKIAHSIKISSNNYTETSSMVLPTEAVNAKATTYLIRAWCTDISSDEIKVTIGGTECHLGVSDYGMNTDSAGEDETISKPIRSDLLFIPVPVGATTLDIRVDLSKQSNIASGAKVTLFMTGYFSATSPLKFIPYSLNTNSETFTINAPSYHKIAAHLMNCTIQKNYGSNNDFYLNESSYSSNYINLGISAETQLRDGAKPRTNGKHTGLGYGIASSSPLNQVTIKKMGTANIPSTSYVGYFH